MKRVLSVRSSLRRLPLALVLLGASGVAVAHPGHGVEHGAFFSGLTHPLLGIDHLLAMVAIGLWSLRQSTALRRATPWLAALGMIVGAGLAVAGVAMPGVENAIALSVLLAGVMLATLVRLPGAIGGTLVFAFLLVHGHAHGTEMPANASFLLFLAGFTLTTLAITLAARGIGQWLGRRDSRVLRVAGGAIAACGAAFALS